LICLNEGEYLEFDAVLRFYPKIHLRSGFLVYGDYIKLAKKSGLLEILELGGGLKQISLSPKGRKLALEREALLSRCEINYEPEVIPTATSESPLKRDKVVEKSKEICIVPENGDIQALESSSSSVRTRKSDSAPQQASDKSDVTVFNELLQVLETFGDQQEIHHVEVIKYFPRKILKSKGYKNWFGYLDAACEFKLLQLENREDTVWIIRTAGENVILLFLFYFCKTVNMYAKVSI
jgi:hypothetical protein